jgi:hypothetical protein
MRSGNVARTTADAATHVPLRTENADIGLETVKAFGASLERAGFFEALEPSADTVPAAAPGVRMSALRDDHRTTWTSGGASSRRNYTAVMNAMLAKVTDPGLSWQTGPLDTNAFWICTQ